MKIAPEASRFSRCPSTGVQRFGPVWVFEFLRSFYIYCVCVLKEGVFFGVFLSSRSCVDGSSVVLRVGDEVVIKSRTASPVKLDNP